MARAEVDKDAALAERLLAQCTDQVRPILRDLLMDLSALSRFGDDPIAAGMFFKDSVKRLAKLLDQINGNTRWRRLMGCTVADIWRDEQADPHTGTVVDFLCWKQSHARPIKHSVIGGEE